MMTLDEHCCIDDIIWSNLHFDASLQLKNYFLSECFLYCQHLWHITLVCFINAYQINVKTKLYNVILPQYSCQHFFSSILIKNRSITCHLILKYFRLVDYTHDLDNALWDTMPTVNINFSYISKFIFKPVKTMTSSGLWRMNVWYVHYVNQI